MKEASLYKTFLAKLGKNLLVCTYLALLLQIVHIVAELCKVSPNHRMNSKLEGHVIVTFEYVPTKEDCADACSFNNDCHSINFFQANKTCELNNANHITSPVSLIKVTGSDYINYDKRPPRCDCTSNMSCAYSVTLNDKHCYCKLGYGGHNCETDLKLVALYPMNARYQARSVQADAPDGVISNVNCTADPSSPLGGSCTFKGLADSYIEIPNKVNGKLDVKGSVTLLAFISTERKGPIFHYGADIWGAHWSISDDLVLYVNMRKRCFREEHILHTYAPIAKGNWTYVGTTYDRSTGVNSLWAEGKNISSVNLGSIDLATQYEVRIGAKKHDRRFFKGKIACMQVYKQALNELQIKEARHNCDRFV